MFQVLSFNKLTRYDYDLEVYKAIGQFYIDNNNTQLCMFELLMSKIDNHNFIPFKVRYYNNLFMIPVVYIFIQGINKILNIIYGNHKNIINPILYTLNIFNIHNNDVSLLLPNIKLSLDIYHTNDLRNKVLQLINLTLPIIKNNNISDIDDISSLYKFVQYTDDQINSYTYMNVRPICIFGNDILSRTALNNENCSIDINLIKSLFKDSIGLNCFSIYKLDNIIDKISSLQETNLDYIHKYLEELPVFDIDVIYEVYYHGIKPAIVLKRLNVFSEYIHKNIDINGLCRNIVQAIVNIAIDTWISKYNLSIEEISDNLLSCLMIQIIKTQNEEAMIKITPIDENIHPVEELMIIYYFDFCMASLINKHIINNPCFDSI